MATVVIITSVMNFFYQIFSSVVFLTVLSGTLVYVIVHSIFEKFYKYEEIIGKIDNKLKFYRLIIKNPGDKNGTDERTKMVRSCSQELLQLSCDLESSRKQLIIRSKKADKNVSQAAKLLMDLHIGVYGYSENTAVKNLENLKEIRKLLHILELSE